MPKVVASLYEIQDYPISKGSVGEIYKGWHLRLQKNIVAKKERPNLSSNKVKSIRDEVKVLKGLSHTYIPQIYDFFLDDGALYIILDYIEGESLKKALARVGRFKSHQVIEWAKQVLEALIYLHSRPPHGILHGDINPSNIMLTPQGDIRLIDFNIALFLGADGAVAVGHTDCYASPEHYGKNYSTSETDGYSTSRVSVKATTFISDDTILPSELPNSVNCFSVDGTDYKAIRPLRGVSGKTIILDARSDIYGLGATLYHLIKGEKPHYDALEVIPLNAEADDCPAGLAAIVNKSMAPDKNLRFQTAEEMLAAFVNIHRNDPRKQRFNLIRNIAAVFLITTLVSGAFITFVGQTRMQITAEVMAFVESSQKAYIKGDVSGAILMALKAIPEKSGLFTPPVSSEAKKALTDALGVYDMSDGFKAHQTLSLPSFPLMAELSPDGKTAAIIYAYETAIVDMESGKIRFTLPITSTATAEARFLDNTTLVYAGQDGLCAYDISDKAGADSGDKAGADAGDKACADAGDKAGSVEGDTVGIVTGGIAGTAADDIAGDKAGADAGAITGAKASVQQETKEGSLIWKGAPATAVAISSDGNTIAAINRDEDFALLYDANGNLLKKISFRGKKQRFDDDFIWNSRDRLFALSASGRCLAVSFDDGSLLVFDTHVEEAAMSVTHGESSMSVSTDDAAKSVSTGETSKSVPTDQSATNVSSTDAAYGISGEKETYLLNLESEEGLGYIRYEGAFSGEKLALSATSAQGSDFAVFDMESIDVENPEPLCGSYSTSRFGVLADESGVYVSLENNVVMIDPFSTKQQERAWGADSNIRCFAVGGEYLLASLDGAIAFFDNNGRLVSRQDRDYSVDIALISGEFALVGGRDMTDMTVFKLERHKDAEILKYDAGYKHDEARINADGSRFMLFSAKGFRIYNSSGALICEQTIPNIDNIRDQQFCKSSGNLVVTYDDALRIFSGRDGGTIFEETGLKSVFYAPYGVSILDINGRLRLIDPDNGETLMSATVNAGETLMPTVVNAGETLMPIAVNAGETLMSTAVNAGETLMPTAVNAGESLMSTTVNASETLMSTAVNVDETFAAQCGVTVDSTFLAGRKLIGAAKNKDSYHFAVTDGAQGTIYNEKGQKLFDFPLSNNNAKTGMNKAEAFFTDTSAVISSIYGQTVVYDIKTGRKIADLEKDAYLTYITQIGDYIVSQYISTDGRYFGLLLDSSFKPIASLPYLCDTWNGKLIFDYPNGLLRQSQIYSLEQLISLADNHIGK